MHSAGRMSTAAFQVAAALGAPSAMFVQQSFTAKSDPDDVMGQLETGRRHRGGGRPSLSWDAAHSHASAAPPLTTIRLGACGHDALRTSESGARHQRQCAVGVGPHRQCRRRSCFIDSHCTGRPQDGLYQTEHRDAVCSFGQRRPSGAVHSCRGRMPADESVCVERLRPCRPEDKGIRT
jgi:hypothetical protein